MIHVSRKDLALLTSEAGFFEFRGSTLINSGTADSLDPLLRPAMSRGFRFPGGSVTISDAILWGHTSVT